MFNKGRGCGIEDHDFNLYLILSPFDRSIHAGDMVGGQPVDNFAVGGGVKRTAGGKHPHGFKQVCFALGIFPIEESEAAFQRKIKSAVIAKFAQREVRKIHILLAIYLMNRGVMMKMMAIIFIITPLFP